jgi:YesN/AraC family two-component response regulator
MIVDDEMGIAEGLKIIIERIISECKVIGMAFNGVEGYDRAKELTPDVIITDIMMPQVNGLEMIKNLKDADCKARFIILSGYSEFEYAKKGIELGVKFFINKPVEEEEIYDCLLKVFREIEQERANKEEIDNLRKAYENSKASMDEQKSPLNIPVRSDIITEIKKFVIDNFNRDVSLTELSARFFMNPSYLSQLFKEKTGETYLNYVMKIRINKAAELIKNTDLKVYEICEMVGYTDTNYFSKLFVKIIGCSPSEYKKRR